MSVVLSYVDTTKAIIASDGLATYKNKRTAHSNEQKIIHLNDNVLLGYAGHLHSCLRIVSLLTNAKPENQPIVNAMLVEDTNTFIQKCIASFDSTSFHSFNTAHLFDPFQGLTNGKDIDTRRGFSYEYSVLVSRRI